ncbi:hypothetical protein CV83906_2p011 (plasmid) [Escherichia coli]|nr:hypothetical protein CV83906_2p011 [Escherichia coli]
MPFFWSQTAGSNYGYRDLTPALDSYIVTISVSFGKLSGQKMPC